MGINVRSERLAIEALQLEAEDYGIERLSKATLAVKLAKRVIVTEKDMELVEDVPGK